MKKDRELTFPPRLLETFMGLWQAAFVLSHGLASAALPSLTPDQQFQNQVKRISE